MSATRFISSLSRAPWTCRFFRLCAGGRSTAMASAIRSAPDHATFSWSKPDRCVHRYIGSERKCGWNSVEQLLQDVLYALRMMRRSPVFTAVAVLSLALGIGANTAIFSLIKTVMLSMLPVREPRQLVELLTKFPGQDRWNTFSWQAYGHMRDHNHVFSDLIAVSNRNYSSFFHVRGEGLEPERVDGAYVAGNFFPVLGAKSAIGRLIDPEDDHMNDAAAVAVVSWSYWKSRFNLDPAILGKRIVV